MKPPSIEHASTHFLKAVLLFIALAVLAFCISLFPRFVIAGFRELPEVSFALYPGFIGMYASALPFFFALFQAFKLLRYIDANNAFSELSVSALKNIKFSAIAMSVCYGAALPLAYIIAELDDAPGLILISTAVAGAPLIVATFAAVLQKLVRNAVDMKTEHDLTV